MINDNFTSLDQYFSEIRKYKLLTREEERELAIKSKNGDINAKNKLINHNLRLVVKIATDYLNRGLSFEDLICEGNIGLIRAAEKYDPDKSKFSIYACFWIKQNIIRAIYNSSKTIRLSISKHTKYSHILDTKLKLEQELGRKPSTKEISNYLNIPVDEIELIEQEILPPVSLEETIRTDDEDLLLINTISDNIDIEDDYNEKEKLRLLRRIINEIDFTPNEKQVIFYRYGFINGKALSLTEIGNILNLSRERIRQIENNALNKIIKSNLVIELSEYFNDSNHFKDIIRSKREEPSRIRIRKTIYDYFKEYDKEYINYILESLPTSSINYLIKTFGDDFNIPVDINLTKEERSHFYYEIKKLRLRLNNNQTYTK